MNFIKKYFNKNESVDMNRRGFIKTVGDLAAASVIVVAAPPLLKSNEEVSDNDLYTLNDATSITDFDNSNAGQMIRITAKDSNTMLIHNEKEILLKDAANYCMSSDEVCTLMFDGSRWIEISRG